MIEMEDKKVTEEQKKKEGEQEEYIPYYSRRPQFGNKGPSKIRQQFSNGMTYFLVIVTCVIFYFALLRFDMITNLVKSVVDVLKPVIYGLALAYLLNPIIKYVDGKMKPILEKKMSQEKAKKLSRTMGIIFALIFLIALIVALCNMLIPELYKSIRDLFLTLPGQINEMVSHVENIQNQDNTIGVVVKNAMEEGTKVFQSWFRTDFMTQVNTIMSNVTVGIVGLVVEFVNFILGLIVSVYVLYGKERFTSQAKKLTYAFLSNDHANMLLHLTKKSNEIFGGFIIGKIIDSAIIGVLCFIGLSILHMPYTLLVSVVVGITNVIPFFGPYIGAIPSAILITLEDPKMGLYFLIFILILQQIDGNIIGPHILGDSTGLSPFWVLFSILVGGGLFGFVGMIMGVPTLAVIFYIIGMIAERKLEKKNLPVPSECYGETSYVDDKGQFNREMVSKVQGQDVEETEKEEQKVE